MYVKHNYPVYTKTIPWCKDDFHFLMYRFLCNFTYFYLQKKKQLTI